MILETSKILEVDSIHVSRVVMGHGPDLNQK